MARLLLRCCFGLVEIIIIDYELIQHILSIALEVIRVWVYLVVGSEAEQFVLC